MERVRSLFKLISEVAAYRENSDRDESESITVREGDDIFAADQHQETRCLNGKPVSAVLFTQGTNWFWMPRSVFERSTEKTTAADRTGIPFQR